MAKNKLEKENNKENKEENGDSSIGTMSRHLSDKKTKDYHFHDNETVHYRISTGSLLLDMATGGISPGMVLISGHNNEGKSPAAYELVRQGLLSVENSKGLLIISEGRILPQNLERLEIPFVTKPEDWKVGTIFVLKSNVYEFCVTIIRDLVKNNPDKTKFFIVCDALDSMVAVGDIDRPYEDQNKVAGRAVISKRFCTTMNIYLREHGHVFIMIAQVSSSISVDPYAKVPAKTVSASTGLSLLHTANWVLEIQKANISDYILDNPAGKMNDGKTKVIGKYCKVNFEKTEREESKKLSVAYPVKYGRKKCGIWQEAEVLELLKLWSYVRVGGAGWLEFNQAITEELKVIDENFTQKIQGEMNFIKYLENNPKVNDYLVAKFKAVIFS